MSKPVSNREVEDVLSSIRRLVSEKAAVRDSETSVDLPETKLDKLLLTPDQLIDLPSENCVANTDPISVNDALRDDAVHKGIDVLLLGDEIRLAASPEPEESALEETLAELEAAVDQDPCDWEPDGSEVDDDAERALRDEDQISVLEFRSKDRSTEASAAQDQSETPGVMEAAEVSGENISVIPVDGVASSRVDLAQMEVTPEVERDIIKPQSIDDTDGGGGVEATNSETDLKTEQETVFVAADLEDAAPEEVDFIDEDALRDLVSRMLREELQGVVGQRMTQSIRRLVRREIARALTIEDDL